MKVTSNSNIRKVMKRNKMFKVEKLTFERCKNEDKQLCKDMKIDCTVGCFRIYNPNDKDFVFKDVK